MSMTEKATAPRYCAATGKVRLGLLLLFRFLAGLIDPGLATKQLLQVLTQFGVGQGGDRLSDAMLFGGGKLGLLPA